MRSANLLRMEQGPVAWLALGISALNLGYAVWNEITKRRLQFEARFTLDWPENEHLGPNHDQIKPLGLENIGAGSAHNVRLMLEMDPAGVAYGAFAWVKVAAGGKVERLPDAQLPDSLELLIAHQHLEARTPRWRRRVTFAEVRWETPFGTPRSQRFTVTRRSLHL
ncbi:hypothetical protein DEJ00_12685 [Curtobacterium sp. MCLR17_039]|nr:hypothetical protein DEJ00_12685 [Curtobacterium sp. MCLR17_039]